MTIAIRTSGPADRPQVLALMDAARGADLSAQQRAEHGFVQGEMDESVLARFESDTGVFLAEQDGQLAGFAMTSRPGTVTSGPAPLAVQAVRDSGVDADARLLLYGPAAVAAPFRGHGVLTLLLRTLCHQLGEQFDLFVAFVELANAKSLAVHQHYGMTERARFDFNGRQYASFTFSADLFTR